MVNWLVVWNMFCLSIGNNHPEWLIFFQRGGYTTNQLKWLFRARIELVLTCFDLYLCGCILFGGRLNMWRLSKSSFIVANFASLEPFPLVFHRLRRRMERFHRLPARDAPGSWVLVSMSRSAAGGFQGAFLFSDLRLTLPACTSAVIACDWALDILDDLAARGQASEHETWCSLLLLCLWDQPFFRMFSSKLWHMPQPFVP